VFINTIFRELESNYKCSWTEERVIDKLHAFENKVLMKVYAIGKYANHQPSIQNGCDFFRNKNTKPYLHNDNQSPEDGI